MQQNNDTPQIMAMLSKIFAKLEEHDLRFDAIEQRLTSLEQRMTALEQAVVALEKRITALEQRVTALEKRVDLIETRLSVIEKRLDVIDQRLAVIEKWIVVFRQWITKIEQMIHDLMQRMTAQEEETRRLGALFEDNEKKLQHILDVLSSYLRKMEKVDHLDESMIKQTAGLEITKIALANHIQNRKIHLMPARGRPKKNPDETET